MWNERICKGLRALALSIANRSRGMSATLNQWAEAVPDINQLNAAWSSESGSCEGGQGGGGEGWRCQQTLLQNPDPSMGFLKSAPAQYLWHKPEGKTHWSCPSHPWGKEG